MASRDSGTVRPTKRKRVFLAAAVVLLVCVLAAGAVSAEKTICVKTAEDFRKAVGWSLSEDTKIVVMGDIMLDYFAYPFNKYNFNLTLTTGKDKNHTISWKLGDSQFGMFHVKDGKHLTITGNGTGTLTLNGKSSRPQTLITIEDTGYFTLGTGGILANNTATNYGGAVYMKGGTFTMKGGTIANNTASEHGGAVYMKGGTFTMKGGTIANNTASEHGGAVYMTGGTFTMTGGSITNNTATSGFGGALCVDGDNNNKVTITLSGGRITGNTATNGGGVFMKGGNTEITLSDNAEISNNKAVEGSVGTLGTGHGGGVHIDDGTFTMSNNAKIAGNTANTSGGGVYVKSGTFTMTGGSITNNTAEFGFGGALCVDGDNYKVTITLSDTAKISNNTATNGGGVFMKGENTEITLSGTAEISNNKAVEGVWAC